MPERTPIEKLQPCLLDRLTDEAPGNKEESSSQRVISLQTYRDGVMRDLNWLFSTDAYPDLEGMESFRLRDYPEAFRSVINYGIRQLFGRVAPDMRRLQQELAAAIKTFEPRLAQRGLVVRAEMDRQEVKCELDGELWANPVPQHLQLRTVMDLETGQASATDASHG